MEPWDPVATTVSFIFCPAFALGNVSAVVKSTVSAAPPPAAVIVGKVTIRLADFWGTAESFAVKVTEVPLPGTLGVPES